MYNANKKTNYHTLATYLSNNQQFDESYALISHYIQLQGNTEATEYHKLLLEHGIDIDSLPSADDFNKELGIPFPASKEPKFTFIDLFAGIGGFRMAMQNLGGKCVFSSEWDDAAKQTYFENYGEVPNVAGIAPMYNHLPVIESTKQVEECRKAGAVGVAFFAAASFNDVQIDKLKKGVFRK